MSALTPADLLEKAADIIARNGWTQGDFYLPTSADGALHGSDLLDLGSDDRMDPAECAVCAGGGINVAADHAPDVDDPEGVLLDALEAFARRVDPTFTEYFADDPETEWADDIIGLTPDVYAAIGNWNDHTERTAEQVITELRACAADLRQGAGQ